jgi:hypothetical protein
LGLKIGKFSLALGVAGLLAASAMTAQAAKPDSTLDPSALTNASSAASNKSKSTTVIPGLLTLEQLTGTPAEHVGKAIAAVTAASTRPPRSPTP